MDDLIRRSDAVFLLENQFDYLQMVSKEENPAARFIQGGVNWSLNTIKDIPAVDAVEVRHARWTHEHLASTSGGSYAVIRCSECGWAYPIFETRYCPTCGARMDGRREDGDA